MTWMRGLVDREVTQVDSLASLYLRCDAMGLGDSDADDAFTMGV